MGQMFSTGGRSRTVMAAMVLGTVLSAGTGTAAAKPADRNAATTADPAAVDAVSRYCQTCWRNARLPIDRWSDCTQQVFVRLLERVPTGRWASLLASEGEDKREFLRAIDAVKKRTQRAKKFGELSADVSAAGVSRRDEWEAVNTAADRVLSDRQRRIVSLTANGWTVPDIASELGTTTERVSDEKYKAIRKLRVELGTDA
jgi:DNA-directed RNA polymerase specialized sigma24 family protein